MAMIRSVYEDEIYNGMVELIRIPDIIGVAVGRDVGYFYVDLPEEIKKISGTNIREGKSFDVPPEVEKIIKNALIEEETGLTICCLCGTIGAAYVWEFGEPRIGILNKFMCGDCYKRGGKPPEKENI